MTGRERARSERGSSRDREGSQERKSHDFSQKQQGVPEGSCTREGLVTFLFRQVHTGSTGDNRLEFGTENYCFVLLTRDGSGSTPDGEMVTPQVLGQGAGIDSPITHASLASILVPPFLLSSATRGSSQSRDTQFPQTLVSWG